MRRRRLLWQLYLPYLAIILLGLLLIAWHASRSLRQFHLSHAATDLKARAALIRDPLTTAILAGDLSGLDSLCQRWGQLTATRITVIDPQGTVLGDTDENPARMDNHANRPEVREALAGRTGTSIRYSHTIEQKMMYVAEPIQENDRVLAVLRASLSLSDIDQALRAVYRQVFLGGLAVAVIAAAFSLLVTRRISRPLQELTRGAGRFAGGHLDQMLSVPDSEEIGSLAEAMNAMANQLDQRIRAILQQRQELEAILGSMVEGVLAVDAEGRVLTLNRAGASLLQVDCTSFLGRPLQEIIRNPELMQVVQKALVSEQIVAAEIALHGERQVTLQANATGLRGPEGQQIGALLVLNDVTRLRRLENLRRDFVANVSHELKTPITAIKGFIETLLDGAWRDPEDAKRFLSIVAYHADRLQAIVEDLLSLSHIEQETEKEEVTLSTGPLRGVLEDAVQACAARAAAKDIPVDISCPGDLEACFSRQLIEQAVVNLIDNALKYSEPGQAVEVAAQATAGGVQIAVRDHGCGIAREHLPRLFERFYRVDKARSRKLGGTGLGLAIVKHIAQAHGGRVQVQSVPGEGSTFTIELPGR